MHDNLSKKIVHILTEQKIVQDNNIDGKNVRLLCDVISELLHAIHHTSFLSEWLNKHLPVKVPNIDTPIFSDRYENQIGVDNSNGKDGDKEGRTIPLMTVRDYLRYSQRKLTALKELNSPSMLRQIISEDPDSNIYLDNEIAMDMFDCLGLLLAEAHNDSNFEDRENNFRGE